ncbi:MAG: response regulator [Methylacidiphilales bacterium]|nr:response regulator [Candidatus Methylacidiphilales bacterium]
MNPDEQAKQRSNRPPPALKAPTQSSRALPRPAPALKASSSAPSLSLRGGKGRPTKLIREKMPKPQSKPASNEPADTVGAEDYTAMFRSELAEAQAKLGLLLAGGDGSSTQEYNWHSIGAIFHTLKGSAATVGMEKVAALAASAEIRALDLEKKSAEQTPKALLWFNDILEKISEDSGVPLPDRPKADPPVTLEPEAPPELASAQQHIASARDLVSAWQKEPGQSLHKENLLEQLKQARQDLASMSAAELDQSFDQLEEFIRTISAVPTETFFLVASRCLSDAQAHLEARKKNLSLHWNRKWNFYFSSLRVAMATELPNTSLTPSSVPADTEMLQVFSDEAATQFEVLEQSILSMEKGVDRPQHKDKIRRCFHTLKGAANSIGLHGMGAGFHALEDLMASMPDESAPESLWQFLLHCLDESRAYLNQLSLNPGAAWNHDWKADVKSLASGAAPKAGEKAAAEERQLLRVDGGKLRNLMHWTNELVAEHSRFSARLPKTQNASLRIRECLGRLDHAIETVAEESATQESGEGETGGPLAFLKEELQSLSNALNRSLIDLAEVLELSRQEDLVFQQKSKRLQSDLASLNMGPVSLLFRRLERAFRDACTEEGKQAELHTEGVNTQLDRAILDRLYAPLLHVVRNAVAHGIESPELRREKHKPVTGDIRLTAQPHSNYVIIEVQDDGGGINSEAVLKRALERNLVPPGTESLSPDQAVQLLFLPGFSTKETVSNVAGRGVGLDVVKRDIEALNGTVGVTYETDVGTTWTLRIPLTLSASEALLVHSAGSRFAIPLSYIDKCVRLLPEGYVRQNEHVFYRHHDEALPYYDLHKLLQMRDGQPASHGILVDSGTARAILGVHNIVGRREIITKDPGPLLNRLDCLSGAAADSDGSLFCILQISNLLVRRARLHEFSSSASRENGAKDQAPPTVPTAHILLVDDSPTVRKMQEAQLRKLGFRVTTACDGQEALEALAQGNFDLVITDLEMPNLDGTGLVQRIRENPQWTDLPVVLVTSRAGEQELHELKQMGATACLQKPFSRPDFLRELKNNPGLKALAGFSNQPSGATMDAN